MRIPDDRFERVLAGKENLLFDGAMGTLAQSKDLVAQGQVADSLCLSKPDAITAIHKEYVEAGADVITTNTFNANRDSLAKAGIDASVAQIYAAATACARAATPTYVAGDIGSTGQMLEPYGDLEPDEAYELFAEQARAAADAGVDFILIETIPDVTEAEIAIKAAKEQTDLPVFASMTFDENGFTLMGEDVVAATTRMEAAGADVVGINCSHGPEILKDHIAHMLEVATRPVLVQPNAGMPEFIDGKVVYAVDPANFAHSVDEMLEMGVSIIGSCCGSTPAFTAELAKLL